MAAPTPPGYIIEGSNTSVMFVSGYQAVLGWHNAEYVIGWKKVMKMILCIFETNTNMKTIQTMLHQLLLSWAKDNWMGRGKEVPVMLAITEEEFLPLDIKQIKINFNDELSTVLRFYVKRRMIKKKSRSLKELTLTNLSFLVNKPESTECLELPYNLAEDLKDEIENCWKSRHILDNMIRRDRTKVFSNCDRSHAWKAKYFE